MKGAFLAIDWGTTNRRVYRVDRGEVSDATRDDRGVLAVRREEFPGEVAALRRRWNDLPVLCVGMVGSSRGWREAPYVPTPASIESLAQGAIWIERGAVAIAPGVSHRTPNRCDVMRGEELQFLGTLASGLAPPAALLCQPGTHSKWARVEEGCLREFTTAMTGELFSLLRRHSLLADMLGGRATTGKVFNDGVHEARHGRLLSSLFSARAAQLLSVRDAADGASFVSGLLIGTDVQAQLRGTTETIWIIGDAPLAPLYAAAIECCGGQARIIDGATAFVAGAAKLWELLE